ncbi:MAG: hypothetical protein FJ137_01020 [Deltaproteobacteria bacterium]|nr:hypothetical protein [Deltaproteobacteria bacterium]
MSHVDAPAGLRAARRASSIPLAILVVAVAVAAPSRAAPSSPPATPPAPATASSTPAGAERYVVELRVIEGSREGSGEVDARLGALSRDLKSLPFRTFKLKDAHTSVVGDGERVGLEIPGAALQQKPDKKARRFLVVSAHGRQPGGKLRFTLGIEALKFETLVSVPDGGTIIVGGPRGDNGNAVLFAFTARTQK